MSQLNTLALRDALITRVTDFALDDHFVSDPALSDALKQLWSGPPETGGLGSDLWVEGAFPSTPADETMQALMARKLVNKTLAEQLDRTGAFPFTQIPYRHQLESIEAAASRNYAGGGRPAIVVMAGTGAGKTESFLIPMLNELWEAPKEAGGGISALILYPMNALVNDQVGRLDQWLKDQTNLSFFHFTSETPENAKVANDRKLPLATPARFRTRQQARGCEDAGGKPIAAGPNPDILVTNYSMLEYMLCRPQDNVFFGRNLRVVVLDEAHIYSGNLAAEITLLLRRVMIRCGRNPEEVLCIATSATIGGKEEELKSFAARLFSKPEALVRVINGKPYRPVIAARELPLPLPGTLIEALTQTPFPTDDTLGISGGHQKFSTASEESWQQWILALKALSPDGIPERAAAGLAENRFAAPLLCEALSESGAIAALQNLLWNGGKPKRLPLQELCEHLFGRSDAAAIDVTRQLLQAGAIARSKPGTLPLIPNRVHYLLRGPEGILITFSAQPAQAMASIGMDRQIFSAGADPSRLGSDPEHPLTLFRCNQSGWWGVAGKASNGTLEPVPTSVVLYGQNEEKEFDPENPDTAQSSQIRFYSLEPIRDSPVVTFDPATGKEGASGSVHLWPVDVCPKSKTPLAPETVGWFSARARLQLSVVAETALAAMPEYPDDSKGWKPAGGRRLLVFSDSRAEAARLGPRLTRQHEMQVFRAALIEQLSDKDRAEMDLAALREDIAYFTEQIATAPPLRRPRLEMARQEAENTLRRTEAGGTIADWVSKLKESTIVPEIFDATEGKKHEPGIDKAYDAWTRNRNTIFNSLDKLLGREMARRPVWPNPSLETLGLVEVVYPGIEKTPVPLEILGILPPDTAAKLEAVWLDYLAALLDAVRSQGAISLGDETSDHDYQYGNNLLGKLFSARESYRRNLIPLIGTEFKGSKASRRNAFTRNVLLTVGVPESEVEEFGRRLMQAAFDALVKAAETKSVEWLRLTPSHPTHGDAAVPALQIAFHKLGLRCPIALYRCENTGQVWPRTVAGLYPGASEPSLVAVEHEAVDKDPRLKRRRYELSEWIGFRQGLWAEEHSAQLSPQENARLQNLFREGRRNILSSTTTLELGIDIGGLSAVLLGNLPPGKANYLQRAGRAGRRADGTSAVLGFARPTAYEREVFLDFRRYLDRELRRPTIFLDRAPLVRRHAHAWLLGEFFQTHLAARDATGAMDAYGKMGPFTGLSLPDPWKPSRPKPQLNPPNSNPLSTQFLTYLDKLVTHPTAVMIATLRRLWEGCANVTAADSDWKANITAVREEFAEGIKTWMKTVDELAEAWSEIDSNSQAPQARAQANAIVYQLMTLHRLTVIESLADSRVLPRYGFPIGLSRLRVQVPDGSTRTREEDQFRLQRDSMMAMREYTPGSQLLVGGMVITSRGLLKHWTGAVMQNQSWGLRGQFVRSGSGLFSYSLDGILPQLPEKQSSSREERGEFLLPKHGFTTAAWDPPRLGSDFERVGKLEVFTLAFDDWSKCDTAQRDFGGLLGASAQYRNAGELLLMNFGAEARGFAICQKCGYAESEWKPAGKGQLDLPNRFEWHAPLNATKLTARCWADGEAPVWRNHHLAAKQSTHLLQIDFAGLGQPLDFNLLFTLGQALRLTAAQTLEIDERELSALNPAADSLTGTPRYVILYDSLAGGSGHLAELSHAEHPERALEWIKRTIQLLTLEGNMPDTVRHRELIRRLLTSACDDSRLVPERARALLSDAMVGRPLGRIITASARGIPNSDWNLEKLQTETPPDQFDMYIQPKLITGIEGGLYAFERWDRSPTNDPPPANTIVVLRDGHGVTSIGKWQLSRYTQPLRPHRLTLRRQPKNLVLELSDDEFAQLRVVAVCRL
ncbi:MAG: box helicase [Chthoniobacteraceae bacterium]|nr:box helicase [Chthoniobacteraceae bacterium]